MILFPEVQKKAQAELMAVIGAHRLPEFDDEASLPYVCALIKELLRWRSVVPLSVPHRSVEDDEYRGYFIPKGSIVISNIWCGNCISAAKNTSLTACAGSTLVILWRTPIPKCSCRRGF